MGFLAGPAKTRVAINKSEGYEWLFGNIWRRELKKPLAERRTIEQARADAARGFGAELLCTTANVGLLPYAPIVENQEIEQPDFETSQTDLIYQNTTKIQVKTYIPDDKDTWLLRDRQEKSARRSASFNHLFLLFSAIPGEDPFTYTYRARYIIRADSIGNYIRPCQGGKASFFAGRIAVSDGIALDLHTWGG